MYEIIAPSSFASQHTCQGIRRGKARDQRYHACGDATAPEQGTKPVSYLKRVPVYIFASHDAGPARKSSADHHSEEVRDLAWWWTTRRRAPKVAVLLWVLCCPFRERARSRRARSSTARSSGSTDSTRRPCSRRGPQQQFQQQHQQQRGGSCGETSGHAQHRGRNNSRIFTPADRDAGSSCKQQESAPVLLQYCNTYSSRFLDFSIFHAAFLRGRGCQFYNSQFNSI